MSQWERRGDVWELKLGYEGQYLQVRRVLAWHPEKIYRLRHYKASGVTRINADEDFDSVEEAIEAGSQRALQVWLELARQYRRHTQELTEQKLEWGMGIY